MPGACLSLYAPSQNRTFGTGSYQQFSPQRGRSTSDNENALDFFDEERKRRSGLEAQWHQQHDLRNAGRLGHLFEGYGDSSEGTRVQNARNVLDAYRKRHGGIGTPAPSAKAITDADVFKARQRIINGSKDPKDKALVHAYLKQQNAPKKTSFLDGLNRQAPAHVAMLASGAQMAAHSAHVSTTHHNDNSSETNINGGIHVHTNATDAHGIVADIGPMLKRGNKAARADYGLA